MDENSKKESKLKLCRNVLHVLMMKNSAEEAMMLDQYLPLNEEDENYLASEKQENVEIAYYFPLRNEKNVEFLNNHIKYLHVKIEKSFGFLERSEAVNESLRFKHAVIKKDINIIQTRLIGLKKIHESAVNAEIKAETTMGQAANLRTNINLKMQLINRMKQEYNIEYENFFEAVEKKDTQKAIIIEQLHSEVARDLLAVAELEKAEKQAREKFKKVSAEQKYFIPNPNIIEILNEFEKFDEFMMNLRSGALAEITTQKSISPQRTVIVEMSMNESNVSRNSLDETDQEEELFMKDTLGVSNQARDRRQ